MTTSTWKTRPDTGNWNTADNWTPAGTPADTAAFADSAQTAITFSATGQANVQHIEFAENASAYSFTLGSCDTDSCDSPALTISGQGVSNASGKQQSFIVAATSEGFQQPQLKFSNAATAGGDDLFYCAGPQTTQGYGGGVIRFCDQATAGSAVFKAWTGAAAPPQHSTVGGEVSFGDAASAGSARFTIHGSLGSDGDTFGNVVFHDKATAARGIFTNVGGTVAGGDGGNTQFYGSSSAAHGLFNNFGGTHSSSNGGDVAFDGTADGGEGFFYNHAAEVAGAYGGVTSFNNNPPDMAVTEGATAGQGTYVNYGARAGQQGGGGHLEFSARYGSPSGDHARIHNYGSDINDKSSAGHTLFSINLPCEYCPTAGSACVWNHPAEAEGSAAGFTEFSVYGSDGSANAANCAGVPTAGEGTFFNLGACSAKALGGYTTFSGTSSAGNATLIAYSGTHGGAGGRIAFYDNACGGTASVQLFGNGELALGDHNQQVTIGALELHGGIISIQLGSKPNGLEVSGELSLKSSYTTFEFWQKVGGGFALDTAYTILSNASLGGLSETQFRGNSIEGVAPVFAIVGNDLQVTFCSTPRQ